MKVFISHAFGGDDEGMAGTLKDDLAAAGLEGYMAEKIKRYDLLISDKIRQEIDESDWLVAIITERGQASASLHEEIGYALGKGARVALMIEEGVEKRGVLVYGKEYETFAVPKFGEHSRKMARFISESPRPPPPRRRPLGEDARALLRDRKILSVDSPDFAENEHFAGLYGGSLGDDEKPAVIFAACPHDLGDHANVTAPEFGEWVESIDRFEVEGHRIPVRENKHKIDVGTLRVVKEYPRAPPGKGVLTYREFRNNGFLEYGTSHLFLGRNDAKELSLHLCYMVGEFWGFVLYARAFYQKFGVKGPLTVSLSIKNSSELALRNFGNKATTRGWRLANTTSHSPKSPRTGRRNIQASHTFASADSMGDKEIAEAVKNMATTVCNAYGVHVPGCYDANGVFAWNLWETITSW